VSCEDPTCPVCRLRDLFQELKDAGAEALDIMQLGSAVLAELYDDVEFGVTDVEQETVH
jgi:hypothetical protein